MNSKDKDIKKVCDICNFCEACTAAVLVITDEVIAEERKKVAEEIFREIEINGLLNPADKEDKIWSHDYFQKLKTKYGVGGKS